MIPQNARHRSGCTFLSLVFSSLWTACSFAQPILYVKVAQTTGNNDGSSWANAYQGSLGLQTALNVASPGSGTQIWVAQGRYVPAGPAGDRAVSFSLKVGVELYGGFIGNETSLDQRDPIAHEAILSGDLNHDDTPNGNRNDNSLHVVRATNLDSTAILDGLTIRDGGGSGVSNIDRTGANMLVEGGNPVVRNCLFTLGNAGVTGGGGALMASSATIANCRFLSNKCSQGCGGLANLNGGSPLISHCRFESNTCGFGGGGIQCGPFIVNGIIGGRATVQDCDFLNNTGNSGIGMMIDRCPADIERCRFLNNNGNGGAGIYMGGSPSNIISCDFVNNQAPGDGGSAVFVGNSNGPPATPIFANCRFIGNNGVFNMNAGSCIAINCTFANNSLTFPPFQGWPVINSGGTIALRNCLIWGNRLVNSNDLNGVLHGIGISADNCCIQNWDGSRPGIGTFAADPLFADADGADNQPGTIDDDLHLLAGSPCIDTGNDALIPTDATDLDGDANTSEPLPLDFDARPRIMNCHVDIGAFERVAAIPASGDMNADGTLNLADIDPFVAAVLNGNYDCIADLNTDSQLDALDIVILSARLLG